MKNILSIATLFICIFIANNNLYAQKIGFVSTNQIRESLPEAKAADLRIQTIQDEWKREIKELDQTITAKEFEIEKNRLIWTENEKIQSNNELKELRTQRLQYSKEKYSIGGEYEKIVLAIQTPVEEKIYAAIQKVAAENDIDIVWDKSIQPLTYTNFKYDITLKVLKELGVNTSELEAELNKKIEMDPRNNPDKQSKSTPTSRTRKRRTQASEEKTEVETEVPSEIQHKADTPERQPLKIERK